MNLLIVDDHAGTRQLIRELVTRPGDRVRECGSGEQALAALADFRPDWVTLDLVMVGRGGFSVLPALRAACPPVRVAVVSSYDDEELHLAALALGAEAFVPKDQIHRLARLLETGRMPAGTG